MGARDGSTIVRVDRVGQGEVDEAHRGVERALAEHERLDWPLERARSLLVPGGFFAASAGARDAATTLAEARAVFAALRNPLWSHARRPSSDGSADDAGRATS